MRLAPCFLSRLLLAVGALAVLAFGGAARGADSPPAGDAGSPARLCDLGITLALSGQGASAESVFVSLLSKSPRDPRALNNLGNLYLWRGEQDVALAFYGQAGEADSADAGIVLNEATALLLAGDDEGAKARAAVGVARAGGSQKAANLLGLHLDPDSGESEKGADSAQLSRGEVLALLRAATHAVPVDSTHAKQAPVDPKSRNPKKAPAWRSAGARGSEGTDAAAVLYWKR